MLILNTLLIVFVDYLRKCFHINGVPLHISVPGKDVPWHSEKKYDKQP